MVLGRIDTGFRSLVALLAGSLAVAACGAAARPAAGPVGWHRPPLAIPRTGALPPAVPRLPDLLPPATLIPARLLPAPHHWHPAPVPVVASAPPPPPPPAPAIPADHLIGPGVDVLVSPMPQYDCRGFSPPLPLDRVVIDPCAQRATGVPLIVGHNHIGLLWNAATGWGIGTAVHYGGHWWRIIQSRAVSHWITFYPVPPPGAGLQVRTCRPDGRLEWVWDLEQA